MARLRPRLRSYADEAGRELVDVEDGLFADPEESAPVRFLGEYDNVFLAHADRSRITGDASWGAAYARKGAFFIDGFLAGSWRASEVGGRATPPSSPGPNPATAPTRSSRRARRSSGSSSRTPRRAKS